MVVVEEQEDEKVGWLDGLIIWFAGWMAEFVHVCLDVMHDF